MTNTKVHLDMVDSSFHRLGTSASRLEVVYRLSAPRQGTDTVRAVIDRNFYENQASAKVWMLMAGSGWVELASTPTREWWKFDDEISLLTEAAKLAERAAKILYG
jgi:hypothetical protein